MTGRGTTCPTCGRDVLPERGAVCPYCPSGRRTTPEPLVERTHCATARKRKAAKAHRCECGRVVPKGEHYVLHTGFPGHDGLSDITAPMRMVECWRCACRYGRDYLLGADLHTSRSTGGEVSGSRHEWGEYVAGLGWSCLVCDSFGCLTANTTAWRVGACTRPGCGRPRADHAGGFCP